MFFVLVAVTRTSYSYIVGVDRIDVSLLCDPKDVGSLSMLRWSVHGGMVFFNPINLNSESSNLPGTPTTFSCNRGGDTIGTIQICVKGICIDLQNGSYHLYVNNSFFLDPMLNISYGVVFVKSYSLVYPELNILSVPSAVQTITLSINIEGKWNLPDNSNSTNSTLTMPNFSSQNNGVYKFSINNWSGIEVCAIQINLTTTTFIHGM